MSQRMVGWPVLVLLWAVPAMAAQRPGKAPAQPAPGPARLEARIKLNVLFFDNFFHVPQGEPQDTVVAGGLEAHLAAKLRRRRPLEAYGHADYIAYRGFGPSSGVTAGLRSEDNPQSFDISAQYLKGRPSREVGNVLDRADIVGLEGEYSYRMTDDFELTGLGDVRRETYALSPAKESDVFNLGGAVRYRGFGHRFSPEVGLRWGRRDVADDNEDLSQRELFVRLRSTPVPALYLSLRYRRRGRHYSIAEARGSNFGREDTRQQWALSADLTQGERRSWNLYYASEDSGSSRPSGVFQTRLLALGLTVRF